MAAREPQHGTRLAWQDVDRQADPGRYVQALDLARREGFFVRRRDSLAQLLRQSSDGPLLEVGCGTAEQVARTQDRVAIGLDRSGAMLSAASRRHPGIRLVQGDACNLPFRSDAFSVVRAERLLQHLEGVGQALTEWGRVLRLGGFLITSDADASSMTVSGVDPTILRQVRDWDISQHPGTAAVSGLSTIAPAYGLELVQTAHETLEARTLAEFDGIFGLASWGDLAHRDGAIDNDTAARWKSQVLSAAEQESLVYTVVHRAYLLQRAS